MAVRQVELEKIHPNPFQARTVISPDDVYEMAADIKRQAENGLSKSKGLIHIPKGRQFKGTKDIELVEGHTRFEAFRWLNDKYPEGGWDTIPVDVGMYKDAAMDDIAWSENAARRDISAMDKARSLAKTKSEFDLSDEDLAARRGMSRPAVVNLIRLLELPQEVQDAIDMGYTSGKMGLAFLSLQNIPAEDWALIAGRTTNNPDFSIAELPSLEAVKARITDDGTLNTRPLSANAMNSVKKAIHDAIERAKEVAKQVEARTEQGPEVDWSQPVMEFKSSQPESASQPQTVANLSDTETVDLEAASDQPGPGPDQSQAQPASQPAPPPPPMMEVSPEPEIPMVQWTIGFSVIGHPAEMSNESEMVLTVYKDGQEQVKEKTTLGDLNQAVEDIKKLILS